jgi:hypothetical protein
VKGLVEDTDGDETELDDFGLLFSPPRLRHNRARVVDSGIVLVPPVVAVIAISSQGAPALTVLRNHAPLRAPVVALQPGLMIRLQI